MLRYCRMVSIVNPSEFWFRVRLFLQGRGLSYKWLADTLGRRERFIRNRSEQNRVTKKEAAEILSALKLTMIDMRVPIEAFATKHLRLQDDGTEGCEGEIRRGRQASFDDLDEV